MSNVGLFCFLSGLFLGILCRCCSDAGGGASRSKTELVRGQKRPNLEVKETYDLVSDATATLEVAQDRAAELIKH
jgi:hypothetical protein